MRCWSIVLVLGGYLSSGLWRIEGSEIRPTLFDAQSSTPAALLGPEEPQGAIFGPSLLDTASSFTVGYDP